jgi:hypothetical protein
MIERYGTELDCHQAVRPAFDALWNTAGFSYCRYFDGQGRWIGRPT